MRWERWENDKKIRFKGLLYFSKVLFDYSVIGDAAYTE